MLSDEDINDGAFIVVDLLDKLIITSKYCKQNLAKKKYCKLSV